VNLIETKINNALRWRLQILRDFIRKAVKGNTLEFYLFNKIINDNKKHSVLDIGANLGQKTDLLININNKTNIAMFEPFKKYSDLLKNKYKKNKKIEIYNYGIGNINKVSNFFLAKDKKNSEAFSFKKMPYHSISTKVVLKKLDSLNFLKKKKISLIKIDVEQFEYESIKGGVKLIDKNRPIIFFETTNENISKIKNFFLKKKYTLFAYEFYIFKDNNFVFENPIKSWQKDNVIKSNIYNKKLYSLDNFNKIKSFMLNIIALPDDKIHIVNGLKIIKKYEK